MTLSVDVRRVRLKKPIKSETTWSIQLGIVESKDVKTKLGPNPELPDKCVMESYPLKIEKGVKLISFDNGGGDGWEQTSTLRVSRAEMLEYTVCFMLFQHYPDGSKVVKATWEEIFSALYDSVIMDSAPLYCWLLLSDHIGMEQVG